MCRYCEKNEFESLNTTVDYSGLEIAMSGRGILRVRNYNFKKLFETQDAVDINYCPMCRKEAGRVKTILKRYVETLDNHKGIVVKQYKPTGRNIDSIHIQQENGRIWYCPISDVIYVKEESYE